MLRQLATSRIFMLLACGYVSLFGRLFLEASNEAPPAPPRWDSSGVELLEPTSLQPLTREAVLERGVVGAGGGSGTRQSTVMRKDKLRSESLEPSATDETAEHLLERALAVAAGHQNRAERGRLLMEIYGSMGNLKSARGEYLPALHAMNLRLQSANISDNLEGRAAAHLSLGELELKHHRYYAAGTRFADAL